MVVNMTTTRAFVPDAEMFAFPGGEQSIRGTRPDTGALTALTIRGAAAEDLVTAALWGSWADQAAAKILLAPYLPGARQDKDVPFGAGVYAEMLNMANADAVLCLDPHSPVEPKLVRNCVPVSVDPVVAQYAASIPDLAGVISPDAGSRARSRHVAEMLGVPLFLAGKRRDPVTGALSGFSCEVLPESGQFLIVDDICDGGGTFLGLAAAAGVDPKRLHLWVTHGIFSKGPEVLTDVFGSVACTDSHPGSDQAGEHRVFPVVATAVRNLSRMSESLNALQIAALTAVMPATSPRVAEHRLARMFGAEPEVLSAILDADVQPPSLRGLEHRLMRMFGVEQELVITALHPLRRAGLLTEGPVLSFVPEPLFYSEVML